MDFLFGNKQKNKEYKTDLITENLRVNFAKKVYSIVSIQLLLTTGLSFISMTNKDFHHFQISNPFLLYFSSKTIQFSLTNFTVFFALIIEIAMICNRQLTRQVPTNYIILGLFTLCQAYSISFTCSLADPEIVCSAALLTLSITLGLTVYAMTTKKDFTLMGGAVFCAFFALLPLMFLFSFMRTPFTVLVMEIVGILMTAFYLIYDTQQIMGGKRVEIGIDDYILASYILYQDIVILFLKLLKILMENSNKEDKKKEKK